MQKIIENQKLRKVCMAAVAALLVVCLAAGVLLQYGTDFLFFGTGSAEDALTADTTSVMLNEDATIVTQNSEELLARPTGGKDAFVILEIVPNSTYATFGYFIGGMEPNRDALENAANAGDNYLVSDGYSTPLRRIINGVKLEYLADAAAYQAYNPSATKATGGYDIVLEKVGNDGSSGYFEYVGQGKGLYSMETAPEKSATAKRGGKYLANFEMEDLYNRNAVAANNWDITGKDMTGYNYDAVLSYDSQSDTGYFVESIVPNNETGSYVIDKEKTGALLGFTDIDQPNIEGKTYEEVLLGAISSRDYSNIIFIKYDETVSMNGTDNRYEVHFGYTPDGERANASRASYVISEYTFNPGKGEFLAKLTQGTDGEYYHLAGEDENGEYEIVMTSFTFAARDKTFTQGQGDRGWVWHAATPADGKEYSTLDEYNTRKILWTPSFEEALEEITYNGEKAKYRGYYCRNTFVNNEWFKILCLGVSGFTGAEGQDPVAFLQSDESAKAVKAFDRASKIEIITTTPREVTDEMIAQADFIYISNEMPFQTLQDLGLIQTQNFDPSTTGDLENFKMVVNIYKACINKDLALFVNANLENCPCTNLKKLYQMFTIFKDPGVMAYFLPSMKSTPNNGLNYIDEDTGELVHRYATNYWCYEDPTATFPYNGNTANRTSEWSYTGTDFQIFEYHSAHGWRLKNDSANYPGWKITNASNSYINSPDGRWLIGQWYTAGFLQNIGNMGKIYEILKRDTFNLLITNASLNTRLETVIYVDEFDDEYPIFYQMQAISVLTMEPEVLRVQVFYDANGDGIIEAGQTPFWEAVADGQTATPGCPVTVTDANAIALNYSDPNYFYEGYPVDVKDQFGAGDREKCFVVRVIGRKNAGTEDEPQWLDIQEEKAVSIILRDMFELN